MERKELTSGEAEPLEYGYRVPFYSTMELFIETLTGTCFELRVSPFETVIAVKAKIQRLEGIPITQQYLIWQNMELEDEYCLHDYSITDGSTLKLVLAMRGGPINTRRIAMEEPTFREMADYVDANQEELFENLSTPPSAGNNNKQVTLLVYRDGDQLNFFRVVDRGDGTLTPLSESLSGGSLSNMEEEEDGEMAAPQKWSVSQVVENNITANKMKQLRNHMHNLSIKSGNHTNTKSYATSDETPIPHTQALKDNPKLSVVRRHLTFSPKAIHDEGKSMKTYNTKSGNSFGDIVTSKALPQQPPPSAEEKSLPLETSLTSERQPLSQCEEVSPEPKSNLGSEENLQNSVVEAVKSKIAVKEANSSCGTSTPVKTATSKMTSLNNTVTKTELLRARLNRIKQTMNVETKESLKGSHVLDKSKLTNLDIVSNKNDIGELYESEAKKTIEQSQNPGNLSGKRSPRTQRLLAALSNNGKSTTTSLKTVESRNKLPAKTTPRFPTSLPQGMVFNRHDMYLRSYGLIASPDEDRDAEVVRNMAASVSDPVINNPRVEDVSVLTSVKTSKSSKIMETPHGVKYTTPSRYSRQWCERNSKTTVADNSRTQLNPKQTAPHTVKEGSTKLENPSSYSLFHPYSRDLKPIGRPPQGHQPMPPPYPKLGSHEKPPALGLVSGTPRSKQPCSINGKSAPTWCVESLTGSNHPPHPPLVSNSAIQGKNNVKDQKPDKVQDAENETTSQLRPSTGGISTLRYHGRWQNGNAKMLDKSSSSQQTSTNTTSGVRMNDSPHGKIETMSRQEAREVVDFINKAMDASILRSLVKSPGKETHRGNSGHSASFRHASLSHHHHVDASRHVADINPKFSSNLHKGGTRVERSSLSGSRHPTTSAHIPRTGIPHPPQSGLLPPVNPPAIKKKRCFLCGKKTGLATSYTCRCGNNFCATHRYAETHDCTYDYKTRGRKLLEENNPLVSAPKLPKI